MVERIDFNMNQEKFDEVRQNTIKALERCVKIVSKGKQSISETAYARYLTANETIGCAELLKMAVNVIGYCEMHDQYCERYDPQKPKLRKHIEEGRIPRMKNGTPKTEIKNFQVKLSKTVFTEYDLCRLLSLYPQAKGNDGENVATAAAKMAFTEIEFIANNSKMNAHISSAGGKSSALHGFKGITNLAEQHNVQLLEAAPNGFNDLDTSKIKCTTIAEAFARTIAVSLKFFYHFDNIECGDKDSRFVDYYYVIKKWFNDFVDSVKAQFGVLASSPDIQEEFKRLKKLCSEVKSNDCKAKRVAAAAALYIIINVSFSGNEKNAVLSRMENFEDNFNKRISDLKYLSANMKKIQYTKRDFRKTIKKYINDPTALLILDPPYLKEFGLTCGDYTDTFTYEDMLDMFKLLKNAKCKVILFHSRSYWFDSTAVSYGLHKVGYYVGKNIGKNFKQYYTEIYSLNIDPSVKFFDPKSFGELY